MDLRVYFKSSISNEDSDLKSEKFRDTRLDDLCDQAIEREFLAKTDKKNENANPGGKNSKGPSSKKKIATRKSKIRGKSQKTQKEIPSINRDPDNGTEMSTTLHDENEAIGNVPSSDLTDIVKQVDETQEEFERQPKINKSSSKKRNAAMFMPIDGLKIPHNKKISYNNEISPLDEKFNDSVLNYEICSMKKGEEIEDVECDAKYEIPPGVTVMKSNYDSYMSRGIPPRHGQKEIPTGSKTCLKGYTIILTGVLDSLGREEAIALIMMHGGAVAKTLNKKVTHVLAGVDSGPRKMEKIRERKIPILTEDMLFEIIRQSKPKIESERGFERGSELNRSDCDEKDQIQVEMSHMLWNDKYRPKSVADLVGNPTSVKRLLEWMKNWQSNFDKWKKNSNHSFERTVVLTGKPGVGKTCAASVVVEECGYRSLHLNASDQRSRSVLKDKYEFLLSNRGMNEYFSSDSGKIVLILDEIDGMSVGDQGGLAQIGKMIKNTQIPIIAIANDKYKVRTITSSSETLHLSFNKLTTQQILNRMLFVMKQENMSSIDNFVLMKITESSCGDLRMALNFLQFLKINSKIPEDRSKAILGNQSNSLYKDLTLGPFDVIHRIFKYDRDLSFSGRLELFFTDYSLIPAFVFQNYLKVKPRVNSELKVLRNFSLAVESISHADLLKESIYSGHEWSLLPAYGVVSTMAPAFFADGILGFPEFPSYLSKGTKIKKNASLLQELKFQIIRTTCCTNTTELALDYLPLIVSALTSPLIEKNRDGIQQVLSFMKEYQISKKARDIILELSNLQFNKEKQFSSIKNVPTAVKSAFTRMCNSLNIERDFLSEMDEKEKNAPDAIDDDAENSDTPSSPPPPAVVNKKKKKPTSK